MNHDKKNNTTGKLFLILNFFIKFVEGMNLNCIKKASTREILISVCRIFADPEVKNLYYIYRNFLRVMPL